MTTQSIIRQQILTIRKNIDQSYKDQYQPLFDEKITEFTQDYQSIALYCAVRNEISVDIVARDSHKRLALPITTELDELCFVDYPKEHEWRIGAYKIPEPMTNEINFIPELCIVPLSVMDHFGTRIGMGKGYYDRYLKEVVGRSVIVGVGWDFQLVDEQLERQEHDMPMDYFISPSYLLSFNK